MNVKALGIPLLRDKKLRRHQDEALDALQDSLVGHIPVTVFEGAQAAERGEPRSNNPYGGFDGANWSTGWILQINGRFLT